MSENNFAFAQINNPLHSRQPVEQVNYESNQSSFTNELKRFCQN